MVECKALLLQHVNQTTRSRNDYVQALAEDMTLLAHRDTTDAQQRVQMRVLPVLCKRFCPGFDVLVRLRSQLARGTNDDADRTFASDERHLDLGLKREHDEWQAEGECLPGSRESDAYHISPRETGTSSENHL